LLVITDSTLGLFAEAVFGWPDEKGDGLGVFHQASLGVLDSRIV
jgi:hypothetical protein